MLLLLMVIVGLLLGAAAVLGLVWYFGRDVVDFAAARARHDLADFERRTVQQMLAAELEARRSQGTFSSDVIETSGTEYPPYR